MGAGWFYTSLNLCVFIFENMAGWGVLFLFPPFCFMFVIFLFTFPKKIQSLLMVCVGLRKVRYFTYR
jgi:hypothetical protein